VPSIGKISATTHNVLAVVQQDVEYYWYAKLDGKVEHRFWAVSKNNCQKTDKYQKLCFCWWNVLDNMCRMEQWLFQYWF